MRIIVKRNKSKLFNRLVSDTLHRSVEKVSKRTKAPMGIQESLEANLKLQLQNNTYKCEPAEIYFHRRNGKQTEFKDRKTFDKQIKEN